MLRNSVKKEIINFIFTCLNCLMAPFILNESAAIIAIPSPGSRSCRRDALGVAIWWWQYCSGCELCRIIRELGDVVNKRGGGGWPDLTLSLDTDRAILWDFLLSLSQWHNPDMFGLPTMLLRNRDTCHKRKSWNVQKWTKSNIYMDKKPLHLSLICILFKGKTFFNKNH